MHEILAFIADELRSMWRFRWVAVLAAWLVCVAGWVYVLKMPDVYSARASLYLRSRTELTPLLQGVGAQQDVGAQLAFIETSLASQPQLEKIADRLGLIKPGMTPQERQGLAAHLRSRYSFDYSGTGGRGSLDGVFKIGYYDENPDVALNAVDALLQLLSESFAGEARLGVESAQSFLNDQIAEYEQRLREKESRMASFKRENIGMMPGESGDYFTRLQREISSLNELRSQLTVQQSLRDELNRQLSTASSIGSNSTAEPAGMLANTETTRRLDEANRRLDELLLRYTERHPDVTAARETIAQLEVRRKAELAALAEAGGQLGTVQSSNPVIQQLQMQLNDAEAKLVASRALVADAERRVAQLQALLGRVTEVETEFAQLSRDYDVTNSQYQELIRRREQANVGGQAQESGSVRFDVLEPPRVSFQPVGPDRLRFYAMVLIAGLMASVGVAFGLSKLRPVFNNAKSLASATGLPVLGQVGLAWLERHRSELRRGYFAVGTALAFLLVTFGVVVVFSDEAVRVVRNLLV